MPRLARLDARPPYSAWLEGGPEPRDGGQAPGVLHHINEHGGRILNINYSDEKLNN